MNTLLADPARNKFGNVHLLRSETMTLLAVLCVCVCVWDVQRGNTEISDENGYHLKC